MAVLDAIGSGLYSHDDPERYRGLVDDLTHRDYFMICADFDAYAATQQRVAALWREPHAWWRASVLNTANMGWFSSDRTIREYCGDIWNIPLPVAD
jgi:starch phosphorylase